MSQQFYNNCGPSPSEIADEINKSLVWASTPQGGKYWSNVFEQLKALQDIIDSGQSSRPIITGTGAPPASISIRPSTIPVSSGSVARCIDCSLMRCAAPHNRCPECDANIAQSAGGIVK
jgi:hypothetical protein